MATVAATAPQAAPQETGQACRTRPFAGAPPRVATGVFRAQSSGSASSFACSSATTRPADAACWPTRPPGVEGWLPIASLMNLKVFLLYRRDAAPASRGDVPAARLPCRLLDLPQELLRLAVSRRHHLRIPVEAGDARRSAAISACRASSISGCAASSTSCWPSSSTQWLDVRRCHPRLPGGPIRRGSDVKMLNFFRYMGLDRRHRGGAAGGGFGVRAEFLVPLPVPVRRDDGTGFAGQPAAHPARHVAVHRLRQVRQGLPFLAAGGQTDHHPVRRVHRLHGMRGGLPGGGRAVHGSPAPPARTGMGDGGGCGDTVPGYLRAGALAGLLAHRSARRDSTSA